ncbi:MAG TPA: HesA/MoeB/ThiF family protein, partial [Niabella sp.]|nr:HesA/MoeB/ThiF family protein [Niabella sp.]
GLGCPVLQYLCGAGVGMIGIIDDDLVSLSNLHRQVLYRTSDVGNAKVTVAAARLQELNPDIIIKAYKERLFNVNAPDIISDYDIIVDGSDNFPTRYLVNDTCVLLGKPLVYGAIAQYQGQVSVFNYRVAAGSNRPLHYRDLFPELPGKDEVPNCSEAGVLGMLPGMIGTMMAAEVVKIITGIGSVSANELITYDMRDHQVYKVLMTPNPDNIQMPATIAALQRFVYDEQCVAADPLEITPELFTQWTQRMDVIFVDVRDADEQPRVEGFLHLHIPLSELEERADELKQRNIVLFCASGKRSLTAARLLLQWNDQLNVSSLKGGIHNWLQTQSSLL